jgi:hypothetical protein
MQISNEKKIHFGLFESAIAGIIAKKVSKCGVPVL